MDDFYLFSDSEERLTSDFISIQRILGDKGLALNPEKTALGAVAELDVAQTVDAFKRGLLRVRRNMISVSGHRYEVDREEIHADLQPNQVDYLLALLKDPNINEADADLVLSLLHDHGQDVLQRMTALLERFPSLIRSVYNYARSLSDKSELSSLLLVFVKTGRNITEDQLFWIAKLAEDHLSNTPAYRNLLDELYSHPNGTPLSKAKVLEIPEQRFGFDSLREEQLRVGKSDWLAWSAAVGSRAEPAARRNYILAYFAKGSYMNHLISECVSSLP